MYGGSRIRGQYSSSAAEAAVPLLCRVWAGACCRGGLKTGQAVRMVLIDRSCREQVSSNSRSSNSSSSSSSSNWQQYSTQQPAAAATAAATAAAAAAAAAAAVVATDSSCCAVALHGGIKNMDQPRTQQYVLILVPIQTASINSNTNCSATRDAYNACKGRS